MDELNLMELREMLALVVLAMVLVIVAMGVDLMFGWRKAKERGDAHTSYAFSRTINKFALYEGVLIIGACIDTMIHFAWPVFSEGTVYYVPFVVFFLAIVLCGVELWSMREKADQKTRNRANDVVATLAKAIGRENLVKILSKESDTE